MNPMLNRRHRAQAERLARALQNPGRLPVDVDTSRQVRAAQALTPTVHPRPEWRAVLKDRLMRDSNSDTPPEGPGGDSRPWNLDGAADPQCHVREVVDERLGRLRLADVERIDPARAQQAAEGIADLTAHAEEGLGR